MTSLGQARSVSADEETAHEPDVPDPGAEAERVEFDVTSGEDLVDRLPAESEVPKDLKRTFWRLVLQLKVAILGVSFGLLLAYFWNWTTRGGLLVLLGVAAGVWAYRGVRRFQRS